MFGCGSAEQHGSEDIVSRAENEAHVAASTATESSGTEVGGRTFMQPVSACRGAWPLTNSRVSLALRRSIEPLSSASYAVTACACLDGNSESTTATATKRAHHPIGDPSRARRDLGSPALNEFPVRYPSMQILDHLNLATLAACSRMTRALSWSTVPAGSP